MNGLACEQAAANGVGVEKVGIEKDRVAKAGHLKKFSNQRFALEQDVEPDQVKADPVFQLAVGQENLFVVEAAVILDHLTKSEIPVSDLLLDFQGQHFFHAVHRWTPW